MFDSCWLLFHDLLQKKIMNRMSLDLQILQEN